jgi:Domain of unknown function (DUF1990)
MRSPRSRSRRLATATRWPIGITLTSWRYLWRTTPMHRVEVDGSWAEDAPAPVPAEIERADLQEPGSGTGPLFHRHYRTRIREGELSPEELVDRVAADPDRVAPSEFATFQKLKGEEGRMRINDEFVVRMPGPWDGPVRVIAVTPRSFRLATLRDHLEAGQIEFRSSWEGRLVTFEIESWARSGDRFSDLLYDRLRMSKEIQLHMWTSTLERVVKLARGRMTGGIDIRTRKVSADSIAG